MSTEIFYLTSQVQRWLNRRVARHLAAQTARLTHTTHQMASRRPGANGLQASGGLGYPGISDSYGTGESIATIDAAELAVISPAIPRYAPAGSHSLAAQMAMLDSARQMVRA